MDDRPGPRRPVGAAPGVSRLVQVHIRTLAQQEDSARWAMRWQATGATGALFPAWTPT